MWFTPSLLIEIFKNCLGATETVEWKIFSTTAELYALESRTLKFSRSSRLRKHFIRNYYSLQVDKLAIIFGNEWKCNAELLRLCDVALRYPVSNEAFSQYFCCAELCFGNW